LIVNDVPIPESMKKLLKRIFYKGVGRINLYIGNQDLKRQKDAHWIESNYKH
jgi:hypothetical protein